MASKGKTGTQPKLTAILRADAVGYSRLMGADEAATLRALTECRQVFFTTLKSSGAALGMLPATPFWLSSADC